MSSSIAQYRWVPGALGAQTGRHGAAQAASPRRQWSWAGPSRRVEGHQPMCMEREEEGGSGEQMGTAGFSRALYCWLYSNPFSGWAAPLSSQPPGAKRSHQSWNFVFLCTGNFPEVLQTSPSRRKQMRENKTDPEREAEDKVGGSVSWQHPSPWFW